MLDVHALLLPEEARHRMENVLLSTDFSSASAKCFEVADSLMERPRGKS